MLLSRQPRGSQASVLCIRLWMISQQCWSVAVNLWTNEAVEKWITAGCKLAAMDELVALRPVIEDDLSWLADVQNDPAASGPHEWHGTG